MHETHPWFRVEAPEYIDEPIDIFADQFQQRLAKTPGLTIRTVVQMAKEIASNVLLGTSAEQALDQAHAYERVQHTLAFIADAASRTAALDAVCYLYGLLGRGEESMDQIAKRNCMSRQAFSKTIEYASAQLHVQPRGSMRTPSQKSIYRIVHRDKWKEINQDAPTPRP